MFKFIEAHKENAIIASLFAAAISVVVSIVSAYFTIHYNFVAQDRQTRLEQIKLFDQSSQSLIDASGAFIAAINDNDAKGLSAARTKLSAILAAQMNETDSLSKFLAPTAQNKATQYQSALDEFNKIAQKTAQVTDMRPWAESFGRAIDAKNELSREIYTQLGMTTKGQRS